MKKKGTYTVTVGKGKRGPKITATGYASKEAAYSDAAVLKRVTRAATVKVAKAPAKRTRARANPSPGFTAFLAAFHAGRRAEAQRIADGLRSPHEKFVAQEALAGVRANPATPSWLKPRAARRNPQLTWGDFPTYSVAVDPATGGRFKVIKTFERAKPYSVMWFGSGAGSVTNEIRIGYAKSLAEGKSKAERVKVAR